MDSFLSGIWEVFGDDFGINFFNGDEQRPEIDAMERKWKERKGKGRKIDGNEEGKWVSPWEVKGGELFGR